jgi:hypothetical protein
LPPGGQILGYEEHRVTLAPPPRQLVDDRRQQLGRFSGAVRANLLDAPYLHLPRPLRRLRLKEWQAVQLASPRVFVNVALFDAKLMQLMQVKVYDRERREKTVHEWKLRPGAFSLADQLFDSCNSYRDRRGSLAFTNRIASTIAIDIDQHDITGHIELATSRGASHVASLPFAGDVGMYSHKGMFPATGELRVGDTTFAFSGDTLALLDDHKGYYPYVMRWDWVTSAVYQDGVARGFNLTRNQCRDPERYNENCAWIGETLGILPAIEVTREHERTPNERWTIRDRDGRVSLQFTPTVPGDVSVNAVIVHSKYRGPFGHFEGRLEPEGLPPIVVDGWFGMGEDFHLRC